ncbi:MAG: hypothetical protein KGL95_07585, partial [Patescibacteria group bacterium]|nr:hypothetical protein [Patescibacteria group bacterium]
IVDIPTNAGSWGIVTNPLTNKIFQTNEQTGEIFEIDGNTNTVINKFNSGIAAQYLAINPVTNKLYVSSLFSNNLEVIDIPTVNTGKPLPSNYTSQFPSYANMTNVIKITPQQLANLIGNNTNLSITPKQLSEMMGNSTNLNMSPEQLSKILGNDSALSKYLNSTTLQDSEMKITPKQLSEMMGNSTNLNMSPEQLSKILGDNATLDLTPNTLQEFLNNKTMGNFNASLSFSPSELANLTKSLDRIKESNFTGINQTSFNDTLLHVICIVKSGELSKLFDSMAIPLSSCQIKE